ARRVGLAYAEGRTDEELAEALADLAIATQTALFLRASTSRQLRQRLTDFQKAARRLALLAEDLEIQELFALAATQEWPPGTRECGFPFDHRGDLMAQATGRNARLLDHWAQSILQKHAAASPKPAPIDRWLVGGQLPHLYKHFFGKKFTAAKWKPKSPEDP